MFLLSMCAVPRILVVAGDVGGAVSVLAIVAVAHDEDCFSVF